MSYLLFVEVDSVVMHATSITTTSRMLSVFTWCKREGYLLDDMSEVSFIEEN